MIECETCVARGDSNTPTGPLHGGGAETWRLDFRTLIHEVAHAILHGVEDHHARPEMEVEAESVAFVVSSVLGLDTGDDSFSYVAAWAGEENAQAMVLRSGQRIVKAVNMILDAMLGESQVEQEAA